MIILFDLDSTLTTIEGCDLLAEKKGMGDEIKAITKATMDGTMDFDEAFVGKTMKLAPSKQDQEEIGNNYCNSLTAGVMQLVQDLQTQGHTVGILTQGYRNAALIVAELLHIEPERVFGLEFNYTDDGMFLEFPDQILKYESGKKNTVELLKKKYPDEPIIVIGDSVSDLHAGEAADLFIGFGGVVVREKVLQNAGLYAHTIDSLRQMLMMYVAQTQPVFELLDNQ